MDEFRGQIADIQVLSHLWLTLLMLVSMILISRTVVAGTKYSSILVIVVFGLIMGKVLVMGGVSEPGLADFPFVVLISKATISALIVSFFVGGQEFRKILKREDYSIEDMVVQSEKELVLGTRSTQFVFIVRAFFILLGLEAASRFILGGAGTDVLKGSYIILAYIGIVGSVILIDYRARITDKQRYIAKGVLEMLSTLAILLVSYKMAAWIKPLIGLPQIFFAMILSAGLGMVFSRWHFGPTIRALLFAGLPMVLAGNFLIGGSRILEAFSIQGMAAVMTYGFFGQIFWMFAGISALIFLGKANHVRNLAPGMAGALSHSGLTGACTAGDFGERAASRAPIMINIPFFGHIFVFSILAASATRGELLYAYAGVMLAVGLILTAWSMRLLSRAGGEDSLEVKGLMSFSFGWQLTAIFGSFVLLSLAGMPLENVAKAVSSALSHFGLFAAVQGGMFGVEVAGLIAFIFAMPFLVHPLVFGLFGQAVSSQGRMPVRFAGSLALIGLLGVLASLWSV